MSVDRTPLKMHLAAALALSLAAGILGIHAAPASPRPADTAAVFAADKGKLRITGRSGSRAVR